ncbi:hypothetical protein [Sphingomonas abietis]|uniref:Uncharacterized protein n=1 Tax=Sphingomonas abietis TaxID=3012344 RepID=A0ABY7NTB0_9SPHN|nr:hypothetical protein [Sphingomonas abietis]WBO22686.1 hypothetical protein PBT88_00585 [Sphingomonas abietis]
MTTALAFTKGAGRSDSLLITRADGGSERIECPKQRIIPRDMIDLYRVTCAARHCPPLPLDETAITTIRAEFARLTHAWEAVPVGGTLTLAMG